MRTMAKVLAVVAVVLVAMAWPARAADAVAPETVTNLVNTRTDVIDAPLSATTYYLGSQIFLTNCIAKTVGGATQGLNQVVVEITVGTPATNLTFFGTTYEGEPGVTNRWMATVTIPNLGNVQNQHLQVKLIDSWTNSYIYPWKKIVVKESL